MKTNERLVDVDRKTVLLVDCRQSTTAVYVDDREFYVRTNPATDKLEGPHENPRYPLELFQRVVMVSLETMKIVRSLPALDILEAPVTILQPEA